MKYHNGAGLFFEMIPTKASWFRDRMAIGLVEVSIWTAVGSAIFGLVLTMLAQSTRQSRDLARLQGGLTGVHRLRRLLDDDLSAVPSDSSIEVSATRLVGSGLARCAATGKPSLLFDYRVIEGPEGFHVHRQKAVVAGPFSEARFEEAQGVTANRIVRLVVRVACGRHGVYTPIVVQASLPVDPYLPGLADQGANGSERGGVR